MAGPEGRYQDENEYWTLVLGPDGTASMHQETAFKIMGEEGKFVHDIQGRWTEDNGHIRVEGTLVYTVSGKPDMTEKRPLVVAFKVESNGELVTLGETRDVEASLRFVKMAGPDGPISPHDPN